MGLLTGVRAKGCGTVFHGTICSARKRGLGMGWTENGSVWHQDSVKSVLVATVVWRQMPQARSLRRVTLRKVRPHNLASGGVDVDEDIGWSGFHALLTFDSIRSGEPHNPAEPGLFGRAVPYPDGAGGVE